MTKGINNPLAGVRALVTGSGIGIGRAIVVELARQGASVAVHHPPGETGVEGTIAALDSIGVEASAHPVDLTSIEGCVELVDRASAAMGGLDLLVNNAALSYAGPFEGITAEIYGLHIALNIGAAFWCSHQALRHFRDDPKGRIVNIGSFHGDHGFPGYSLYAATKGAINAMTRALAIELAPRGVRVNTVSPGLTEVPRYFDIPGYTTELGDQMVPIGRVGKPEDIANVVAFVASDQASYLTGQVITVDGGTSARMGLWWEESATVEVSSEHLSTHER